MFPVKSDEEHEAALAKLNCVYLGETGAPADLPPVRHDAATRLPERHAV